MRMPVTGNRPLVNIAWLYESLFILLLKTTANSQSLDSVRFPFKSSIYFLSIQKLEELRSLIKYKINVDYIYIHFSLCV